MGVGDEAVATPEAVCSICLDPVIVGGRRSLAILQCGHEFHLDCIGSAFNAKGIMQCPNCRNVENGDWRSANVCPTPVIETIDEWLQEREPSVFDFLDANFNEDTGLGRVPWCPDSGLTSTPTTFDEAEYSRARHDFLAYSRAVAFADHLLVPYPNPTPSPYAAHLNHWTGPSVPSNVSGSYSPSVDPWDRSSPAHRTTNRIGGSGQNNGSDFPRSAFQPLVLLPRSASNSAAMARAPVISYGQRLNSHRAPMASFGEFPHRFSFDAYWDQPSSASSHRVEHERRDRSHPPSSPAPDGGESEIHRPRV